MPGTINVQFYIHGEDVAELEVIIDDAGKLLARINERSLEEIRIEHRLIQQLCAEITPKSPVIRCAGYGMRRAIAPIGKTISDPFCVKRGEKIPRQVRPIVAVGGGAIRNQVKLR